mmetsp:Transcript_18493/g.22772  ORF Transcript_18493/g.22772 Transcript_18493/m.22772 type:complete len:366 (+) Transcript_18493:28-1125(+)
MTELQDKLSTVLSKNASAELIENFDLSGYLKVNLWGSTFIFPGNNDSDIKWSIDNIPQRTLIEFKQKLITFFMDQSKKSKGNLDVNDITFKRHGDIIADKKKNGTAIQFKDTNLIGDVLYIKLSNRDDLVLPDWCIFRQKNERKLRKKKIQAGNKAFAEYAKKNNIQSQNNLSYKSENKEWTINIELDKAYYRDDSNGNSENKDNVSVTESKVDDSGTEQKDENVDEYKVPFLDITTVKELKVHSSITVGKLRQLLYDELKKDKNNKGNKFLQNGSNNDITLKHKYSVWMINNNDTEIRHMGHVKNGATIKVGLVIPFWWTIAKRLNGVMTNMLDGNDNAKSEINGITKDIKMEFSNPNDSTKHL